MSSDRELLEMAAKAAGIEGEYVCWCINGFKEGIRKPGDTTSIPWNPLVDDGDALRLAVKLRMLVDNDSVCAQVIPLAGSTATEPHATDPCAATRRAIVRAAAEIGKSMP